MPPAVSRRKASVKRSAARVRVGVRGEGVEIDQVERPALVAVLSERLPIQAMADEPRVGAHRPRAFRFGLGGNRRPRRSRPLRKGHRLPFGRLERVGLEGLSAARVDSRPEAGALRVRRALRPVPSPSSSTRRGADLNVDRRPTSRRRGRRGIRERSVSAVAGLVEAFRVQGHRPVGGRLGRAPVARPWTWRQGNSPPDRAGFKVHRRYSQHASPLVLRSAVPALLAGCADSSSDTMTFDPSQQNDPWAPLARYIDAREAEFEAIPADRREELTSLGNSEGPRHGPGGAHLHLHPQQPAEPLGQVGPGGGPSPRAGLAVSTYSAARRRPP